MTVVEAPATADITPAVAGIVTIRTDDGVELVAQLTAAEGTPRGAVVDTSQLTNDTTLRWPRGTEPDLAGYEVVWRETTDPTWSHVIAVGDVTTVTVHLSKDNVFFGLRAVDKDGHRSPVAFPLPG